MSDTENKTEWFLARDGKQHGPLNDVEMRKVVEGGFLKPSDLVWRQGFANWMAASTVFQMAPQAPPPAPPPRPPEPSAKGAPGPQPRPAPQGDPTAPDRASRGPSPAATASSSNPSPTQQMAAQPAPQGGGHPSAQAGYPQGQPGYPQQQAPQRSTPAAGPMAQPAGGPSPGGQTPGSQTGPRPQPGTTGYQLNPQSAPQRGPAPQSGAAPAPASAQGPSPTRAQEAWRAAEQQNASSAPSADEEDEETSGRRFPWLIAAIMVLLAVLGGAGLALYKTNKLPGSGPSQVSSEAPPKEPAVTIPGLSPTESRALAPAERPTPDVAIEIDGTTPEQIEKGLLRSALWTFLKKEFPEWYSERVAELVRMRADQQNDKAVQSYLTRSLVDLRRKNAEAALASSPARLRFVATSFIESLTVIAAKSTDACFAFISQGEAAPRVLELAGTGELSQALQVQFRAIFEAAVEGRKAPAARGTPQRNDFDMLAFQLAGRGWTPTDLQLFSDAGALAKAKPDRVCKMVQDWFHAQLGVTDEAVQARLLSEALKPVVAG